MGYSIRTKDGIVINNIPDNIPKDDPSLKKRVEDIRASRGMETPPTALESVGRGLSSIARGVAVPATGAALGGALAGPPGAIAGSLVLPAAELVSKGAGALGFNLGSPYELAQRGLTKLGFPEPRTGLERAAQAGGEALGGVGGQLGALSRLATTANTPVGRNIAAQLSALPERQLAASVPVGATAQAVGETTESPTLGMLAGVGAALPFGIKAPRQTERIPTIDELKKQSNILYEEAKNSGVVFKKEPFKNFVNQLEEKVDDMGLDADIQPAAFKALKRFKEASNANNSLKEIEKLRRIARGAAGSTNDSERTIAKTIIDDLDDFVETADPTEMLAGTKEGLDAIKNARNTWKLAKKGEILDDIFNSAELRAEANFNQSGMENALRGKLVKLADNKKLMRTFSPDEQEAITVAAKGGAMQNFYRRLGKYAPTSAIPTGVGAGLGGAAGAAIGGPAGAFIGGATVPAIGAAARQRATTLGLREFQKLEDMLKLGRAPLARPTPGQILGTRSGLMGLEQGLLQPDE